MISEINYIDVTEMGKYYVLLPSINTGEILEEADQIFVALTQGLKSQY